ncbi:MAG: hypothetical protein AVDCRST_MAG67-4337, partial [uncultured Solirubrobacteraceae bacterium]
AERDGARPRRGDPHERGVLRRRRQAAAHHAAQAHPPRVADALARRAFSSVAPLRPLPPRRSLVLSVGRARRGARGGRAAGAGRAGGARARRPRGRAAGGAARALRPVHRARAGAQRHM